MNIGLICAFLFSLWSLFAWLVLQPSAGLKKETAENKLSLARMLNMSQFEHEAKAVGWRVSKEELAIIVLAAVVLAFILAVLTKNPLVIGCGLFSGVYLPRFIIEKKRNSNRLEMISKLTDPLRLLVSRIPDQQNITRAIEATRSQVGDEKTRRLFDDYIRDVALGSSVREALLNMKRRVNLKKFDVFIETLTQAHYEGFTNTANRALDKAIEAIEFDLRAIEKVKEQSRTKKRKLYLTLATVWFFPVILSMMNTGSTNVYSSTIQGKMLILFYIIGSVYVYIKGEEYLRLNLDDL